MLEICQKNEITELCKGVHCVDLGESFQTHIYLQNLASIQPRTSPLKFAEGGEAADARAPRPPGEPRETPEDVALPSSHRGRLASSRATADKHSKLKVIFSIRILRNCTSSDARCTAICN